MYYVLFQNRSCVIKQGYSTKSKKVLIVAIDSDDDENNITCQI